MAEGHEDTPAWAAKRVFEAAELRGTIIGMLSMEDLLVSAKRVCKSWKNTVDTTPEIQRKLFMRPAANLLDPRSDDPARMLRVYRGPDFLR